MISNHLRRVIVGIIGLVGAGFFGFLFLLTIHTPEWVETYAAGFIEREVARQIDSRIDALQPPEGDSALARAAAALYRQNSEAIERQRELLRSSVHQRIAGALAQIRDLDCECRERWTQWLRDGTAAHVQLLQQSNARLVEFIQSTYVRVVADLKRDIRIFAGTNAALFLLLLAVLVFKPQAIIQLFVPAILLVVAIVVCSYLYVFGQNWLLTIIYNDYLGFAYLAYLGLAFALLCDIVLNSARVSTSIVNALLEAIGSTEIAVPC